MAQYTDAEMLLAAQVAYMDIPPGMNVAQAIEATINQYQGNCFPGTKEWWQLQWAEGAQRIINDNNLTSYQNWTIKDVCDNENDSGFYGCVINTGDGNAIVGCRGSEQYFGGGQLQRDWKEADLGLLNNTLTKQQADATAYMQYINDNYGNEFGSFSITGHSLGGNLAEHCAVTAPAGMNIDHVINYDGPGFSDEYIAAHQDDIAKVCDKIDHYQHSFVGSLLNPLPGVGREVINARNDPRFSWCPLLAHLIRHDASNIIMENGHVQPGHAEFVQSVLGPISGMIENYGWGTIPLLCVFGPSLLVNAVNEQFGDTFSQAIDSLGNVFDSIGSFLGNLYDKFFGLEASGEFEVNLSSLQVFPDELESIAGRSEDIADDIRTIVSSLKYHSISGAYYKNKLRRIARNIEKAGRFARNSGNVLSDVISLYRTRDADVAASYT